MPFVIGRLFAIPGRWVIRHLSPPPPASDNSSIDDPTPPPRAGEHEERGGGCRLAGGAASGERAGAGGGPGCPAGTQNRRRTHGRHWALRAPARIAAASCPGEC